RRAMIPIKILLHLPRFLGRQLQKLRHIGGHPHVNLGEQLRSPWIERVVQIKNPAADMREFAGIGCVYHARISSEITLILLAAERYINYPLPSGRQERFMKQIIVKASINTFVSI